MKNKVLFLLTAEFPFGTGETFIEHEIKFLAEAFNKIFIIPKIQDRKTFRRIPPNVEILNLSCQKVNPTDIIVKIFSTRLIREEFVRNIVLNPLANKVLFKYVENGLRISKSLATRQTEDPDCFYYSYWLDEAALGIAFLQTAAVKVSRAHGWDIYYERHQYKYLPLRTFLASNLSGIFVVSENGKDYIKGKTGDSNNIFISRLGVPAALLNKGKKDDNAEFNIISISNAITLKRIHMIGEAIRLLDQRKINWKHFGDGPLLDEIKSRFPFAEYYGQIENDSLMSTLSEISTNSVLLNVSSDEGIPVTMMEAMSLGIPCIGTRVGGVSEIIKDGTNGFLLPANASSKEIAEKIKKYLDLSGKKKENFRKRAFETWQNNFNADKNYNDFVNKIISLKPA